MGHYYFIKESTKAGDVDPVFRTMDFTKFCVPLGFATTPLLFHIEKIKPTTFAYCLINPENLINDNEKLIKIKRYLFYKEPNIPNSEMNTYFIGEMKKSIDISKDFKYTNIFLVTYEMIEQWYPKNAREVMEKIVQYIINNQKFLGEQHFLSSYEDDILFVDPKLSDLERKEYINFVLNSMVDDGLIKIINDGFHKDCFVLTAKSVSETQKVDENKNKQAFIAIKFNENEIRINAIENAIAQAGYEPVVMKNVETNNWIMPEIFYHIKTCRFLVADFSLPCDGVYYEAGYATALDKPVIHLFDKRMESENNKLHFDIAQKSTIFYEDYDDLKRRLSDRINATIKR